MTAAADDRTRTNLQLVADALQAAALLAAYVERVTRANADDLHAVTASLMRATAALESIRTTKGGI